MFLLVIKGNDTVIHQYALPLLFNKNKQQK